MLIWPKKKSSPLRGAIFGLLQVLKVAIGCWGLVGFTGTMLLGTQLLWLPTGCRPGSSRWFGTCRICRILLWLTFSSSLGLRESCQINPHPGELQEGVGGDCENPLGSRLRHCLQAVIAQRCTNSVRIASSCVEKKENTKCPNYNFFSLVFFRFEGNTLCMVIYRTIPMLDICWAYAGHIWWTYAGHMLDYICWT